jgi:hypothetical protein
MTTRRWTRAKQGLHVLLSVVKRVRRVERVYASGARADDDEECADIGGGHARADSERLAHH